MSQSINDMEHTNCTYSHSTFYGDGYPPYTFDRKFTVY